MKDKKNINHAKGGRKVAKCTINFIENSTDKLVNGKSLEEYFRLPMQQYNINLPFVVTNTLGRFGFKARVSGGGLFGQADALKLAISRVLSKYSEEYKVILSHNGLLMRDPRSKERKKIFLDKARKRPQYSKR